MKRALVCSAACLLTLIVAPAFASGPLPVPVPPHAVPSPEVDAGLVSLLMVGAAALATYWRKRTSH
jgi:hypothetical protein